jgi:K+-transporting ATPase ATPase A chain
LTGAAPVERLFHRLFGAEPAPPSAGAFPTHGPLFVGLPLGVVVILYPLQYFSAPALGPIVEHFLMLAGKTF